MSDYFPPKPEPNVLERVASGLAEGVCAGVTSPITIVQGAIDKNPRAMLTGAMDAVGMAEVVSAPAVYAGRTVIRESIGNKIQEKANDWLREQGVPVPQSMQDSGYDCLNKVFKKAEDGVSEAIVNRSPQVRNALENGQPGLY